MTLKTELMESGNSYLPINDTNYNIITVLYANFGEHKAQEFPHMICFIFLYKNTHSFFFWSDVWPSMVTHTQNVCSAFNPSKCTHTHTHTVVNTHPEQWAANTAAPGEQLGVRCLAQGSHLSRGIQVYWKVERMLLLHYPHRQFLPYTRFEPTTSAYKFYALSIRPRLP